MIILTVEHYMLYVSISLWVIVQGMSGSGSSLSRFMMMKEIIVTSVSILGFKGNQIKANEGQVK